MRLGKDRKLELIEGVPLFSRCSKRELAKVAAITDTVDLEAGRDLIREGESGREFFVLLEGAVEVRRRGRKIRTLGPGEFFGEVALVSHVPRTASVRTTEPSRALVIRDREFDALLEQMPAIALKVLGELADRLAPESV